MYGNLIFDPDEVPVSLLDCFEAVDVQCGKPWVRVIERKPMVIARSGRREAMGEFGRTQASGTMIEPPQSFTTGWQASCNCQAPVVPCVVLDPFSGVATSQVEARRLGRHSVYVDISEHYANMAIRRLECQTPSLFGVAL